MMAKAFVENGARVFIGGRRKDVVEKSATEIRQNAKGSITPYGNHTFYPCTFLLEPHRLELDVTSKESILSAVRVIETAHGKLDVLVNKCACIIDSIYRTCANFGP
jgi:NADP-dependent 3-hydroxy acid dehydrogenase YdfG